MKTHERGDATEARVIAELKERGIPVAVPFSDNQRYDIVVETPTAHLLRTQIKTGRLVDGKIDFHGKSQHTNSTGNTYETYDGDVDYFLVYTPAIDSLHAVGEHEFDTHPAPRRRPETGRFEHQLGRRVRVRRAVAVASDA